MDIDVAEGYWKAGLMALSRTDLSLVAIRVDNAPDKHLGRGRGSCHRRPLPGGLPAGAARHQAVDLQRLLQALGEENYDDSELL